jgi:hypothetical protein
MIDVAIKLAIAAGWLIYERSRNKREEKKSLAEANKRLPGVDQFEFPVATESDPVPVLFGTQWLRSPNVLWYGFLKRRQQQGDAANLRARYDAVALLSYCAGPVDNVIAIASDGVILDDTVRDLTSGPVDLFVEIDSSSEGGGMAGPISLLPGLPAQDIPDLFSETLTDDDGNPYPDFKDINGDPIMPAFRGLFTVLMGAYVDPGDTPEFLHRLGLNLVYGQADSVERFYFGTQPTFRTIEVLAQRMHLRGYGAAQWYDVAVDISATEMNPAHIIHELLTDPVYGYGIDSSAMDDTINAPVSTFQTAANRLITDELGLSFVYGQQQSRLETIKEVLRHISAFLVRNPRTGKYELRLLRDDYDVSTLPVLGPSIIQGVLRYTRPDITTLPTMVEAIYLDRKTNTERVVRQDDQAGLLTRGEIREEVYYQMAATKAVATRIATNYMLEASAPLALVELSIPYCAACDLLPGDVFVWQWPDYGIQSMVLRVLSVARGMVEDGNVRVRCVEDAYAWRETVYDGPDDSEWIDPVTPALDAPAGALELPLGLWLAGARQTMPFVAVSDFASSEKGVAAVLPFRPNSNHTSYELWSEGLSSLPRLADADADWSARVRVDGTLSPTSFGVGGAAATVKVALKSDSAVPAPGVIVGFGIGTGGKAVQEFVYVTDVYEESGDIQMEFERALFDTDEVVDSIGNPVGITDPVGVIFGYLWDISEPLQMAQRTYAMDVPRPSTGLDNVSNTRVLTSTGRGTLAFADATQREVTIEGRALMPIAPYIYDIDEASSQVTVSWRHRNRLVDQLVFTSDGVTAEAGVTYELRIYEMSPTPQLLRTVTALDGTDDDYVYTNANESADRGSGLADVLRFELKAIRGGAESYFLRSKLYSRV